jgi:hypothetical protein
MRDVQRVFLSDLLGNSSVERMLKRDLHRDHLLCPNP